ncbi:MAG TPA: carboxypeptidase regulatory-like domain-containing protein [Haliangiales bacterium]|nr:carboxypeptidase regulatory-like domain-containing protein [Haliangiales bacterium]
MTRSLWVVILFAASVASAEEIEGTVTSAADKRPMAGVRATIVGGLSATTGADGRFHLAGLRPGTYTIVLRGPGGGSVEQKVEVVSESTLRLTVSFDDTTEVIRIKERVAPSKRRAPEPVERYTRLTPPYSDELIDANDWAVVWLLLHIDARGTVQRVDVLKSPRHYKLDDLVTKHVMKFKFKPGLDDEGRPAPYELAYKLEYVPFWSTLFGGPENPPCAGTGPLNLDSIMPVYRDCEPPPGYDLPKLEQRRWSRFPGLDDTAPGVRQAKK